MSQRDTPQGEWHRSTGIEGIASEMMRTGVEAATTWNKAVFY
jgi:hypothetical protein